MKSKEKIIYVSDFHIPFEDKWAVEKFFEEVKKEKPQTIIIGGDLVDFSTISVHIHHPDDLASIQYEKFRVIDFLKDLRKKAGKKATIYWLEGNHEQRLIKYIMRNAPELAALKELTIDNIFELYRKDINVIYVESDVVLKIDDWVFRHGHEIGYGSSVPGNNARRGIYNFGTNYIQGHIHRGNIIHIRQFDKVLTGVENPCMCEINPKYVNGFSGWHQGWTLLKKDKYGNWVPYQTILNV